MDKKQYTQHFNNCKKYHEIDNSFHDAMSSLCDSIGNSTFNPVFDTTYLGAYLEALPRDLSEHFEYYFYEALSMDSPMCRIGNKYYSALDFEEYYEFYKAAYK